LINEVTNQVTFQGASLTRGNSVDRSLFYIMGFPYGEEPEGDEVNKNSRYLKGTNG